MWFGMDGSHSHALVPNTKNSLVSDARRRCALYIVQLMLAMVNASDGAVSALRSTAGLVERVADCSSHASVGRRRRWWGLLGRRRAGNGWKRDEPPQDDEAELRRSANKLLAALGQNQWRPKLPGQRGIRVLCLDGEFRPVGGEGGPNLCAAI